MSVVRYLAIAALVAINLLLVGLNLQKYELFPFSPDSGAEVGVSVDLGS